MKTFIDPRLHYSAASKRELKSLGYAYPYLVSTGPAADPAVVFVGSKKNARLIAARCAGLSLVAITRHDAATPLRLTAPNARFLGLKETAKLLAQARAQDTAALPLAT
jgi:hypothetical protein